MSFSNDAWAPSPLLVAAYLDGEFEGRDDLAALRQRLAEWLATHPNMSGELAEYRRLRHLWQETIPAEPSMDAWQRVLAELAQTKVPDNGERTPSFLNSSSVAKWKPFAYLAGAAAIFLAALIVEQGADRLKESEPFPVAAAHEVEILHVEGKDTGTLVVGLLPLQGDMNLVSQGDVALMSVEPAKTDNMVPEIYLHGPGRPIIWARSEAEED